MTRLFELRKERGLSQRDMAVEFSVSQSTYNNWENARTQPSIEQLIAIARFFDVSVDYLVGNSDDADTINYITTLSPDEKRFIDTYVSLSPALKTAFSTLLHALAGRDVPTCVFPSGTANLLAANIGNAPEPSALARACRGKSELISCMGTGNKLKAQFEIADVFETSVCPLARAMRRLLKEAGVTSLPVVYSREKPQGGVLEEAGRHAPASISYVPAAAAAKMAEYAVTYLLGKR